MSQVLRPTNCTVITATLTHSKPQKYGEAEVQLLSFLTAALDGDGQLHVPTAFSLNTHRRGGSMGPRAAVDIVNRKMSYWCRDLNPGPHPQLHTVTALAPQLQFTPTSLPCANSP